MKIIVIIPAHNERENIAQVVDNLRCNFPQYDYIVVNDGSVDDTADICRKNHYNIIDLPINLGLSGAFQAGLQYANRNGYDAALQFDGDGQHQAQYIKDMVERMEDTGADIVIGSRFVTKRKPKSMRMVGSYLISWAMTLTTGERICDPTSGMRLFNKKMIEEFSFDANFAPEPDTI
ncbi:MAG: glycosyltransferase family 2 protein, partial [Oscillospiraceae bacterium]